MFRFDEQSTQLPRCHLLATPYSVGVGKNCPHGDPADTRMELPQCVSLIALHTKRFAHLQAKLQQDGCDAGTEMRFAR